MREASRHPEAAALLLLDLRLLVVVLVVDLADDLLEDVLDRHEAGGAAVLVAHDRDVRSARLEVAQLDVDRLRDRDERRRPHQRLPAVHRLVVVDHEGQQVLGVQDAGDVVERLLEHREAARARSCARGPPPRSSGVVSSMPTMSTRGTMTSRTIVSASENTPWSSASSSRETSASAATTCRNCSAASSRCSARSSTDGGGRKRSNKRVERDACTQHRREDDLQHAARAARVPRRTAARWRSPSERQIPSTSMTITSAAPSIDEHRLHAVRRAAARAAARAPRPPRDARARAQRERAVRVLASAKDRRRLAGLAPGRGRPRAAHRRPRPPARRARRIPARRAARPTFMRPPALAQQPLLTPPHRRARSATRPRDDRARARAARRAPPGAAAPRARLPVRRARSGAQRRARCRRRRRRRARRRPARSRTR